jgi:aquaporin Z
METLRKHWPEYLMEAAGLGFFMISAGVFGTVFEYPGSPVHQAIADPVARRVLSGIAMGLTAIAIFYSPWGRRSGAHINPAVTLTFWRLGKVEPVDAVWYMAAQFAGALAGVMLVWVILGAAFTGPPVRFVTTVPGPSGAAIAWPAEFAISFGMMIVVLLLSNHPRLAHLTGLAAGTLVATYIALESPLSGMSINPARTFGSALPAHFWPSWWIYFTAPLLGMAAAAELYRLIHGRRAVRCAKLHHDSRYRCIFRCGYRAAEVEEPTPAPEQLLARSPI